VKKPTPRSSVLTRISQALEQFGRFLFARSDRRAHGHGWQVTPTGRLSRSYRDPRFARFAICPACPGAGCERCGGTGRVERTADCGSGR
jgi:hypothetical protein